MLPDLKRETTTAWLVLGGIVLLISLVLWFIWDGAAPIQDEVAQARAAYAKISGKSKEPMRQRVEAQRQINQELRATIEKLKAESGFTVAPRFLIAKDDKQPGYTFKKLFVEVRQELRQKAEPRRILYDENIGFGTDDKVPDDREAPYLMTMLQLTEKAVGIAISTPSPLVRFKITHGAAVETGPESRPALVREFPLTLEVRGSLKDIMWILHQLSQVKEPGPDGRMVDYPLILRNGVIKSENATPRDDIVQLDAVFQIAGMQFLTPEERDRDPNRPAGASPVTSRPAGGVVYGARP